MQVGRNSDQPAPRPFATLFLILLPGAPLLVSWNFRLTIPFVLLLTGLAVAVAVARLSWVAVSHACRGLVAMLVTLIGASVSTSLLALLYFGVITPIGVCFRAFGRDAMGRRFDATRTTYWEPHRAEEPPHRYFRQY